MKYLLDTDTCIAILRGDPGAVDSVSTHPPDDLAVSSITRYELMHGVRRCNARTRKREAEKVEQFLTMLHEIPFTGVTADLAAKLRHELERKGGSIGPMDTLIAATAVEARLTLVSGNLREFGRVEGLRSENWMTTGGMR